MNVKGFTLVELMIVLVLAGLMISLVGPVGQRQYDKVMIVKDREKFLRVIENTAFEGFATRQGAHLELVGRQLTVSVGTESDTIRFDYISFPQQQLKLNNNGFWHEESVAWFELEKPKTLRLNADSIQ